ncbi:uncharacterized protein LAESUDRAFT_254107 [Laetiporus sulphureus 93-53]|uniref:Uncharacterized protein n=1 Tax=Laetiporus sulphureus 93-53 TaxID=1314785 RepID=A0A165H268_9APHY|nr:uncharacterized protein LAESUDRAFT_254107 [Laetiporus sulphureus 93-53]KZT11141.1 hypothetical protein LAESUDRAFT_254107 [Laetiporus sulphureus 93-53]
MPYDFPPCYLSSLSPRMERQLYTFSILPCTIARFHTDETPSYFHFCLCLCACMQRHAAATLNFRHRAPLYNLTQRSGENRSCGVPLLRHVVECMLAKHRLGSAREGNGSAQSRNVVVYHSASSACKAVQTPFLSPFCNCGMSDTRREVILLRPERVLSQLVSWKSQHMYKPVDVNAATEDLSHFTLPVNWPPRCLTAPTASGNCDVDTRSDRKTATPRTTLLKTRGPTAQMSCFTEPQP